MVDYYKKYLKYKKKYLELKKKGGMSSELAKKLNERLAKQNEKWRHNNDDYKRDEKKYTGDASHKLRPIPEPGYEKKSPKQSPKRYTGDASHKLTTFQEPGYEERPKSSPKNSPNKRTTIRKIESTADRKRRRKQKKIDEALKKLREEKSNEIKRQESLTDEDLDAEPVNIGENLSPEDSKKLSDCFKKAGDDDLSNDCKKFIKEKGVYENL